MNTQPQFSSSLAKTPAKASIIREGASYRAEQGSDYRPAISAQTVGSRILWFGAVSLAPGQRTQAHIHAGHETAFYMLSGEEAELWSGDRLQHRDVVRPGDYLFIPANVSHVAVNRSGEAAVFVGARTEPTAQESVVMQPWLDGMVP
jgi:uncharacterized RmlC-like cupin family protein